MIFLGTVLSLTSKSTESNNKLLYFRIQSSGYVLLTPEWSLICIVTF